MKLDLVNFGIKNVDFIKLFLLIKVSLLHALGLKKCLDYDFFQKGSVSRVMYVAKNTVSYNDR